MCGGRPPLSTSIHPSTRAISSTTTYTHINQLRVGDTTLFGADAGGHAFFSTLKAQLDLVLAQTFPVHFYFFAEEPGTRSAQADYQGKEQGASHSEILASKKRERQIIATTARDRGQCGGRFRRQRR